jgi:hypothetical protein
MEPCGRDDVGASLLFEEDGEPKGQIGSMWRAESGSRALFYSGQKEE